MEKRKSPKGFIVVLPGEIIEIPQDSDKSWLTLFYSLPRELAEKWKTAYDLPRTVGYKRKSCSERCVCVAYSFADNNIRHND